MEIYYWYCRASNWIYCITYHHLSSRLRYSLGRWGGINLHNLKTLWRGKIPLRDVEWTLSPKKERFLSSELEACRNEIWIETLEKHPETYDGEVLILDDFQPSEKTMKFNLSFMRFSRILTLIRTQQLGPKHGTLGVQAIIFSSDKKHFLAGVRAGKSQYCPLFHSVPGGMLEVGDTDSNFENACMREIEEEVNIELAPQRYLIAIMSELHGTVGVVAVISGSVASEYDIDERISGNDEWVNQELSWYDVDNLQDYIPENSLEGLLFVKEERTKFIDSNQSVLWP